MKSLSILFTALSLILTCGEINSFSTKHSALSPRPRRSKSRCRIITNRRRNIWAPSDAAIIPVTNYSQQKNTATLFSAHALSVSVTPVGAIAGILTGGILGGGLHAIAGPDHLAALLPRCCGQRWYNAGRIGVLWGLGHGVSVTILGVLGYALKSQLSKAPGAKALLMGASHLMEVAVGLSLVVIGAMGLREAKEWGDEMDALPANNLSAAVAPAEAKTNANRGNRAVVFNGLLHGFSWDGAPSLAPALAVASWSGNLAFLSAYAAGTVGVMAIATSLVGEGTRRAGEFFNRPDLPQKLSFFSSILAITIGGIWCGLAIKG